MKKCFVRFYQKINILGHFSTKRNSVRDFNAENAMFTTVLNFFKHFLSKISLFSAAKLFENI